MNAIRHHRPLIAWTLYVCLLVNLLACGIAHGQTTGLRLSGIDGMSCSLTQVGSTLEGGGKASVADSLLTSFKCPVCAGAALLALPLLLLGWLLRPARRLALPRDLIPRPAPRDLWPTANPRASPAV
ncbi:TPA: DUF2946 domain-containing protein [Pseudomonas aeruginosa]